MTRISITMGDFQTEARLYDEQAPKTVAALLEEFTATCGLILYRGPLPVRIEWIS